MPGAWPIVICLGSPALSATLYKFFLDLPKSWLPQTEAETFLIRILLSGLILLLGSVSLVILLMYHYRKIHHELENVRSENKSYFHQVSSLNTDKNTLQTLLDETKRNFDTLTANHLSLRESNSKLDELNKIHLAEILRLNVAANEFREEFIAMRNQATESQKELTSLKAEYNDLKQRNAGTEQLALMRGRALEQCEKELEEIKKSPPPPPSDPPQRSFPGVRIPFGNQLQQENRDKSEIALLKKELTLHKKYLKQYAPSGFNINDAEAYEKGWNEAEKHLKE